jgi:hypothetical protein
MNDRSEYFRRYYLENRARIRERQRTYYRERVMAGPAWTRTRAPHVVSKVAKALGVTYAEARILLGMARPGDRIKVERHRWRQETIQAGQGEVSREA